MILLSHSLTLSRTPTHISFLVVRSYGSDSAAYADGNYATPKAPASKTARNIYEEVTFNLREVVKDVRLQTSSETHPDVNITLEETNGPNSKWTTKFHTKYGRCFSLGLATHVTRLGITQIVFETWVNAYVFLHHPGQYLDINSKTKERRQNLS